MVRSMSERSALTCKRKCIIGWERRSASAGKVRNDRLERATTKIVFGLSGIRKLTLKVTSVISRVSLVVRQV